MNRRLLYSGSAFSLGAMLLLGGCSYLTCEKGTYAYGAGSCPGESFQLRASLATQRTDLRDTAPLSVSMVGEARETGTAFPLAELPITALQLDDVPVSSLSTAFAAGNRGVAVRGGR